MYSLPATAPRRLLRRHCKPFSLVFRLRSGYKTGQQYLYIRLSVAGKKGSDYASGLMIPADHWNQLKQGLTDHPEAASLADKMAVIRGEHQAIFEEQTTLAKIEGFTHFVVTAESVKRQWLSKAEPFQSNLPALIGRGRQNDLQRCVRGMSGSSYLTDVYTAYILYLRSKRGTPAALTPITLGRWERTLLLLNTFQLDSGQPALLLNKVSIGWAKRYHGWLQTLKSNKHNINPIGTEQATRFLWRLTEVLQWAYEEGWIATNPIVGVKWPRGASKEVKFLEPHHVYQLMKTQWSGTESVALWWFCLMCCTGLDYPDAVAYARNRKAYEVEGVGGRKIVGRRLKPPHNEYHIPFLLEVEALFSIYPTGPFDYTSQCVNRHTGRIEQLLGIDWRITNKTARKTYGCLMLAAGKTIEEVSRMLGHANIHTTQKYYVKVSGLMVDRSMLRIAMPTIEQMSQPFIRIA